MMGAMRFADGHFAGGEDEEDEDEDDEDDEEERRAGARGRAGPSSSSSGAGPSSSSGAGNATKLPASPASGSLSHRENDFDEEEEDARDGPGGRASRGGGRSLGSRVLGRMGGRRNRRGGYGRLDVDSSEDSSSAGDTSGSGSPPTNRGRAGAGRGGGGGGGRGEAGVEGTELADMGGGVRLTAAQRARQVRERERQQRAEAGGGDGECRLCGDRLIDGVCLRCDTEEGLNGGGGDDDDDDEHSPRLPPINPKIWMRALTLLSALIFFFYLVSYSVDFVPPLFYAVRYNVITRAFGETAYTIPGIYLIFPWNNLRLVPSTVQTISFGAIAGTEPVWAKADSGIQIVLTISVQYRYNASNLPALFPRVETAEPDALDEDPDVARTYHPAENILRPIALSALVTEATHYSPHQIFWQKDEITRVMEQRVRAALASYVSVTSVQLLRIDVPSAFEEAMMQSALARLQITWAEKIKIVRIVQFRTMTIAARYAYVATVALAHGQAGAARQRGLSNAAVTQQTVSAEMQAFSNVTEGLSAGGGGEGGGGGSWTASGRITPHQVLDYAFWQLVVADAATSSRLPLHDLLLLPPGSSGGARSVGAPRSSRWSQRRALRHESKR